MTAFDEDPEYEAQLRDVLDNETFPWREDNPQEEEMGEFVKVTDHQSEDDVLNDAPTFRRMKVPPESTLEGRRPTNEEEEEIFIKDGKAMSEDARSISTGDDSPSAQVPKLENYH
jgi:hypothetical protein